MMNSDQENRKLAVCKRVKRIERFMLLGYAGAGTAPERSAEMAEAYVDALEDAERKLYRKLKLDPPTLVRDYAPRRSSGQR